MISPTGFARLSPREQERVERRIAAAGSHRRGEHESLSAAARAHHTSARLTARDLGLKKVGGRYPRQADRAPRLVQIVDDKGNPRDLVVSGSRQASKLARWYATAYDSATLPAGSPAHRAAVKRLQRYQHTQVAGVDIASGQRVRVGVCTDAEVLRGLRVVDPEVFEEFYVRDRGGVSR